MGKRKKLMLIGLIATYLLALSINLMPALKYPDLDVNSINLFASISFALLLLMFSARGSRGLILFSIVGALSGALIFTIHTFENLLMENMVLDAFSSIQYLLYLIFTIPLFGGNILFGVHYAAYSFFLSLFYGAVLGLSIYYNKRGKEFVNAPTL